MHHINNSELCAYFLCMGFVSLQIPLHGVQRLGAIFPDSASPPATRTVPLPGALLPAGGPKSGGGGRPRPQLEG